MNNTMLKFPISVSPVQTLSMPKDAEFLSVGTQKMGQWDEPVIWALCNPALEPYGEKRTVVVAPTGHTISNLVEMRFLGTFQLENGFVGHVFIDH